MSIVTQWGGYLRTKDVQSLQKYSVKNGLDSYI
jgi:hypothetical protein